MPWMSAVSFADLGARRRRQRQPIRVAQQVAVLVDRLALVVDEPADVVDRPAVAGPDRIAAGVEPGKPERVSAGAGREDVAAEVEGVGLSRLHRLRDHAPRRRRQEARADSRQKAPARALPGQRVQRLSDPVPLGHVSPPRPRPARRRAAVASTLSSWARLLKVPLARTAPSGSSAIANGLPGISSSLQTSASATSSKVSHRHGGVAGQGRDRRLQPAADVAALRGEHGERKLAFGPALEAVDQIDAGAELGPLLGDLERGRRTQAQPQHPDLAGQRQDGDREAEAAASSATASPSAEPLVGGQAALGQEREGGEARRERQVARHRSPADRRSRAEAGAGRAGAPPQQGAEERRGEHGHQRGGEQARPGRCPRRSRRPGRARSRPAAPTQPSG